MSWDGWGAELRQTARRLLRDRGFTAASVLTLALGIGAVSAVWSALYEVVLRPLPFRQADRLVQVWAAREGTGGRERVSPAELAEWRREARSFEELAAYIFWTFNLTGEGEPESLVTAAVTPSLLPLLGVEPAAGRNFTAEEAVAGRGDVVLLSYGAWQRRFGARPEVVGRTLLLDGVPHVVVGVLPRGLDFPVRDVEIWVPLAFDPRGQGFTRPTLSVVGRLRAGVGRAAAQEEMAALSAELRRRLPPGAAAAGVELVSLREQRTGRTGRILLALLAAVAAVLAMAGVNALNMGLARAVARERELAIRVALGSGRSRLAAGCLAENVLLALLAAGAGIPLGIAVMRLVLAGSSVGVLQGDRIGLDPAVVVFGLAVAVATGLAVGLGVMLRVSLVSPRRLGASAGTGQDASPGPQRVREALVVSQVALSLALLSLAGLALASVSALARQPRGFVPEQVLTAQLILPEASYSGYRAVSFAERLLARLSGLPGVRAAGAVSALPMRTVASEFDVPLEVEGRPAPAGEPAPHARLRIATHDYFRTLGIPLVAGRAFTAEDRLDATRVALVSRALAAALWPGKSPLGARVKVSYEGQRTYEVVGVIGDVGGEGAAEAPTIYLPLPQSPVRVLSFVVRTGGDPRAVSDILKSIVWELDRAQPIASMATLEELIELSLARERLLGALLAAFAAGALLLSAVGLYGLAAYGTRRRRGEMAVRLAMGALPGQLERLVLGRALVLTAVGIAVGGAGTALVLVAFRGWVAQLARRVSPADPWIYAGAAAILGVVALAGTYLPARRAARVDPAVSLRSS